MPHAFTPEQIHAFRCVPLGVMPNKVRLARAMAGLQAADVCEGTGLEASAVSKIENGQYRGVNIDHCHKLSQFFGLSIEDLFPSREAVAS